MRASHSLKSQDGAALLVALVFLIVLTILGLATMRGTTLQERMAGGSRDYNLALQAAEAALRDAEIDISHLGSRQIVYGSFPITLWTLSPASARSGCQTTMNSPGPIPPLGTPWNGLCVIDNPTVQLYLPSAGVVDWTSTPSTSSVVYGTYTGAKPIPGVAQQPRYFVELMSWLPRPDMTATPPVAGAPQDGGVEGGYTYVYVRITARAWGASATTQIYLQEVFLLPIT